MKAIQKRLKEAIDFLKSQRPLTNEQLSELLDYKAKNYVSDILSGEDVNDLFLARLEKKTGISQDWVKTGKGMMVVEKPTIDISYQEKRRDLKNSLKAKEDIPVLYGNTRAGTITIYSDDPSNQEPVGHLSSKIFPGCNHAEKINGDSMYPLAVNQGLAIGKIIDKRGIVWGEKYIIHTKHGQGVLKYVHPSTEGKEFIKIVSHNKSIPPQDIPLDDITFCCRVYFIVNPS